MKKRSIARKFSRKTSQRKALLAGLANEIVLRGKITTSEAKAKEMKRLIDKMITKAKKNNLAARRQLSRFLSEKTVKKLVDEIAPNYKSRKGGYSRVIKLGPRASDGAKMAIIELI